MNRKKPTGFLQLLICAICAICGPLLFADGPTPLQNAHITGTSSIDSGTFSIQSGVVWQALAGSAINLEAATAVTFRTLKTVANANAAIAPNGTGAVELLAKTYVGGSTEVTPTASLHLAPGSSAAGSAPLKLTIGTNLAAPEAGAIEFDGTEIYATNSTPTRKRLSTDAAAVAIAASAIDWSLGSTFTKTLAANTTFTFSNATDGKTIVVALTNTASNYTVTWPTVSWSGGAAPTQTVGAKTDVYTFIKVGSVIYGSAVQNF